MLSEHKINALPKLGVGILDNPSLIDFYHNHIDLLDYIAVVPDMLRLDRGVGEKPRFMEYEEWVEIVNWLSGKIQLIAHNVGLSIGSAGWFDLEYLDQISYWHNKYNFCWHSDHLSFFQIPGVNAHDQNVGVAAPVPYDREVLDLIKQRVGLVQSAVPVPFLLENNVYYVDIPGQDMSEPQFLTELTGATSCGILLDLHNIYTNSVNHGFDALEFIDEIDLSYVVEVHIAGGNEISGMYADSHSGSCPDVVWDMLDYIIPRTPNLCGITFEFHESYYPVLQMEGIIQQISQARGLWQKHCK